MKRKKDKIAVVDEDVTGKVETLIDACVALLRHDEAQDKREGIDHCLEWNELKEAVEDMGTLLEERIKV